MVGSNHSLRMKIIGLFSIVVVLSFTIQALFSYYFLHDYIKKKTVDFFDQSIFQADRRIDSILENYRLLTDNIISAQTVQKDLDDYSNGYIDFTALEYNIRQDLSNLTLTTDGINSIQFYFTQQNIINYNFRSIYKNSSFYSDASKLEQVRESNGNCIWISPAVMKNDDYSVDKAFTVVRKVKSLRTGKTYGLLFINIDMNILEDIISKIKFGSHDKVYLADTDNLVILSGNGENAVNRLELNALRKQKNVIVSDISEITHWSIVGVVPSSEINRSINITIWVFFVILFASLLCIIAFSYLISVWITNPIRIMMKGMKEIERGNMDIQLHVKNKDELGMLAEDFNMMAVNLKDMIQRVYKSEISKKEAQLRAIQAQINPHFLYNTLDTIYWMLIKKDEEEIGKLVISLSSILRYSISGGNKFVSIEEEIQQLKNYLAIQKARFQDYLEYVIELEDEIKSYEVPKQLLQPLVENSLFYNSLDKKRKIKIGVEGFARDENIILRVTDNGIGMSSERIKEIFERSRDEQKIINVEKGHTGLGISSIENMIKLLYGENYGLNIISEPGNGTEIEIILPKSI